MHYCIIWTVEKDCGGGRMRKHPTASTVNPLNFFLKSHLFVYMHILSWTQEREGSAGGAAPGESCNCDLKSLMKYSVYLNVCFSVFGFIA